MRCSLPGEAAGVQLRSAMPLPGSASLQLVLAWRPVAALDPPGGNTVPGGSVGRGTTAVGVGEAPVSVGGVWVCTEVTAGVDAALGVGLAIVVVWVTSASFPPLSHASSVTAPRATTAIQTSLDILRTSLSHVLHHKTLRAPV